MFDKNLVQLDTNNIVHDFQESLKKWENVTCPITLDQMPMKDVCESIILDYEIDNKSGGTSENSTLRNLKISKIWKDHCDGLNKNSYEFIDSFVKQPFEQRPVSDIIISEDSKNNRPWVFIECGHVFSSFGREESGNNTMNQMDLRGDKLKCYLCRVTSNFIPITIRYVPTLTKPDWTHCFQPCGHACDLKCAELWSQELKFPSLEKLKLEQDPTDEINSSASSPIVTTYSDSNDHDQDVSICPFCKVIITGVTKLFPQADCDY